MPWIRVSDNVQDPPAHGQAVQFVNTDTGQTAAVQYVGSGTGVPVGFYIMLPTVGRVFQPFATLDEAKAAADVLLHPFYADYL